MRSCVQRGNGREQSPFVWVLKREYSGGWLTAPLPNVSSGGAPSGQEWRGGLTARGIPVRATIHGVKPPPCVKGPHPPGPKTSKGPGSCPALARGGEADPVSPAEFPEAPEDEGPPLPERSLAGRALLPREAPFRPQPSLGRGGAGRGGPAGAGRAGGGGGQFQPETEPGGEGGRSEGGAAMRRPRRAQRGGEAAGGPARSSHAARQAGRRRAGSSGSLRAGEGFPGLAGRQRARAA